MSSTTDSPQNYLLKMIKRVIHSYIYYVQAILELSRKPMPRSRVSFSLDFWANLYQRGTNQRGSTNVWAVPLPPTSQLDPPQMCQP